MSVIYSTFWKVEDTEDFPDIFGLQASSGSGGSLTLQHNSHLLNSSDQRKVNLQVQSTANGFIGFNLRGGSEYGLGLYVSGYVPLQQ